MADPTPSPPHRYYSRPPVDGDEEDLDQWAEEFVEAVFGDVPAST